MCFDDNGVLSLEDELAVFEKIQARIREKYPFFNLKLIACGLKVLGPPHIKKQIDAYFNSKKLGS